MVTINGNTKRRLLIPSVAGMLIYSREGLDFTSVGYLSSQKITFCNKQRQTAKLFPLVFDSDRSGLLRQHLAGVNVIFITGLN